MNDRKKTWKLAAVMAAVIGFAPALAAANSVADFYKGKKIQLIIGHEVGEAYDVYARILVRYMVKYLPGNPLFVPQNMPGAGSLNAANWI